MSQSHQQFDKEYELSPSTREVEIQTSRGSHVSDGTKENGVKEKRVRVRVMIRIRIGAWVRVEVRKKDRVRVGIRIMARAKVVTFFL